MNRTLAGLIFAVVVASGTLAGPLEDGTAAHQRGDFATAMKLWRPLADQGDAVAQHGLGVMYAIGQGVAKDDAEAMKWFRLAAEQGDADAQERLGTYFAARATPVTSKEPPIPEGVVREAIAEALKWWRLSAERGNQRAQLSLASAYFAGTGVPKDNVVGYMWLVLSGAVSGDDDFAKGIVREVRAFVTPDQIAEGERLAREWKPKPQP
jgi:uncharacterized protein